MPTPRQAAEKHNKPAGEKPYCGTCGLPSAMCDCSSYKEWGAKSTEAGSADADDKLPASGLGAKEGGPKEGGAPAKDEGAGGAEKKPFPGAKPFGK